jgi:8-oxo-dGTP diphosphatase
VNLNLRRISPIPTIEIDLASEAREALEEGKALVVGAVLVNQEGQAFVQRRTMNRRLFPGCWDIVGGHVDPGEGLLEALAREIKEETAWEQPQDLSLIARVYWEKVEESLRTPVLEWDFLGVLPEGCPDPVLEPHKVDRYAWVGPGEEALLLEHRNPNDSFIYDLVSHALRKTGVNSNQEKR